MAIPATAALSNGYAPHLVARLLPSSLPLPTLAGRTIGFVLLACLAYATTLFLLIVLCRLLVRSRIRTRAATSWDSL